MIEQVLQRAGEGSAVDRAREDDAVRRAHARDDRSGIIVVLFGWPAVGKRDFLVGEVDQLDFNVLARCTLESSSHRVALSSLPGGVTLPTIASILVGMKFF